MIRFNYTFKTKGPLHTGSDVNAGTLRTLRRQKCILANNISYQSKLSEENRRIAVVHIALGIWYSIDWDKIKGTRAMKIYDEFTNKFLAAARTENKYQFLEILCRSWGIESITNPNVLKAIDILSDYELLDTVRNETMYIILKMRSIKEQAKEEKDETGKLLIALPTIIADQDITIQRSEDMIPCISGNSIRGKMRRLIMEDFCKQVEIKKLDKQIYHIMFTGGFLDQSTKYEDFDRMEKYISMCPMLGVLGAAIGNMTIEGEAKIGWAYPLCKERGTGEKSCWQYLDTVFQTRHDSSKTEKELELTGDDQIQQMKYEYEVFADGTPFEHRIACTSNNELIKAAFMQMVYLFKENPFLGGMGSVGNGEIIPADELNDIHNDREIYCNYLEEKKQEIKEFWENAKV